MGGVFVCIIKPMKSEARQHPFHQLTFCTYFHESSKKIRKRFGSYIKTFYLCTRNHKKRIANGSLAQLNRASDYGSEGCGFESRGSHTEGWS